MNVLHASIAPTVAGHPRLRHVNFFLFEGSLDDLLRSNHAALGSFDERLARLDCPPLELWIWTLRLGVRPSTVWRAGWSRREPQWPPPTFALLRWRRLPWLLEVDWLFAMGEHGRKQASNLPPSQPAAEERLDEDLPDDVAKKLFFFFSTKDH